MDDSAICEQLPGEELSASYSNGDDAIPIDPTLAGPPIDPELLGNTQQGVENQFNPESAPTEESTIFNQYSQAPQGVPFEEEYHPMPLDNDEPPSPSPKPRGRKPQQRQCATCRKFIKNSKVPGRVATCHECGSHFHLACLPFSHNPDTILTYEWLCTECKKCDICHEKGDDAKIMFCDACDRGWHTHCLTPPFEEIPVGNWYCPLCPDAVPIIREEMPPAFFSTGKGKGKAPALPTPNEEPEAEDHIAANRPAGVNKSKARQKSPKKKANGIAEPPLTPKRVRARPSNVTPLVTSVRLRLSQQEKAKKMEEEMEPEPRGLFDDILGPAERDTTKTAITQSDKQKFERSRAIAETKLKPPPIREPTSEPPEAGPSRPLRSSHAQPILPSPSASPAPSSTSGIRPNPTHDSSVPPPIRITNIRFGQYDIATWFNAPFPEEYSDIPDGRLWICEFCLKYMKSRFGATRHRMKCKCRNPPGDEIYRDHAVSIFEVDGRKNKIYCQNLCLLSKMFLDHKSLFYDVEPFLFYVITEVDDMGARFVGYFSKEKLSPKDYNVSCIMTLPVRQRQGWGNLLIDFSYLLSKKEHRLGSPEKPLSGLGALGYQNYWKLAVMRFLSTAPDLPRLEDICLATSMTMEDVHSTLTLLEVITVRDVTPPRPSPGQSIKFPKGRKNGVARRHLQRNQTTDKGNGETGPFVPPSQYEIHWDRDSVAAELRNWESKGYLQLKPDKLQWSPYVLATINKTEATSSADTSLLMTTEKLAALRAKGLGGGVELNGSSKVPATPKGAATAPFEDIFHANSAKDQVESDRAYAASLATDTPRNLRSRSNQSSPSTPIIVTPKRRGRPPARRKLLAVAEPESEREEENQPPTKKRRLGSSPILEDRLTSPPVTTGTSSNRTLSPTIDCAAQEMTSQAHGLNTREEGEHVSTGLVVCDEPNRVAPVIKTIIVEEAVKVEEIEPSKGGAMATIAAAWQGEDGSVPIDVEA
ncbi:Histone acetyltransferase [Mycena indigotica]|uniref:Histone acetyltransferase n=1 Tax=Mycena indigotica TaxID=2126181 RepID=A0A8H6WH49_9AGAR|nr:Histone acetyltransferase [Mycena indigotica]KAF7312129.1 Histone acetyltransferase [Mycena indigotica]